MFTTKKTIVPYPVKASNLIKHTVFYGDTGVGSTIEETIKNYLGKKFESEYSKKYIKHDKYLCGKNEMYNFITEFPIIRYESDDPESYNINSFIKSINVSIFSSGVHNFTISNDMVHHQAFYSETIESKVITYITTPNNVNYIIDNSEIRTFMVCNPNLFLTNNGILIAFFKHNIIAFADIYHFVDITKVINENLRTINSVKENEYGALYINATDYSGYTDNYYIDLEIDFSTPNVIRCTNIGSDRELAKKMNLPVGKTSVIPVESKTVLKGEFC